MGVPRGPQLPSGLSELSHALPSSGAPGATGGIAGLEAWASRGPACHPRRGSEGEGLAFLVPWNLGRPDLASPSQDSRPPARLRWAGLTSCSVKDNTGDCESNCVRLNVFECV